ncbi:MAG TPA: nuclear transport factor 2 family protein [Terriglobales bacterium]|nr:nuclear transport factor 2 family protein [Terriglobales bacterium]
MSQRIQDVKHLLLLVAFLVGPAVWASDCPSKQARDGETLLQIEQSWAKALQEKNAGAVACIVGDDFEDAGTDGQVQNRDELLAHIPQRRAGSNVLSDMHAHIYGDAGYVRGLNTVKDADGKTVAQVRFTDIFVYRNGVWKAVAGHETLLSPAGK